IVFRAIGIGRAAALVLGVRSRALLGAALAGRRGADLHRVLADAGGARPPGELFELVGRLVDRLQMALVLDLLPRRRDVGMPLLGHAPPRELDVALVVPQLGFEEQYRLLDVQHLGHNALTVSSPPTQTEPEVGA